MLSGSLSVSLKLSAKTIKGDVAMTTHKYPILTISKTAKASKGKKSIMANPILIISSQLTFP